MTGALAGITVVALEQAVAAPLATSRLADAGARVIKLERPEGDFARGYDADVFGQSTYFVWNNRGKESCTVDLKQPDDLALVNAMLANCDVFVHNLAPGATERLGLGSASLRSRFPRLIVCEISGYAPETPDYERKAYDLLVQAEAGLANVTGSATSGPSRVGISICDISTGQAAYAAILEALFRRERTKEGALIQISLFDTIAEFMTVPYLGRRYADKEPRRIGLAHPSIAPYGVFYAVDGEILIAIQNDREWQTFCETILLQPALADDARFSRNTVANRQPRHARPDHPGTARPADARAIVRTARHQSDRLRTDFHHGRPDRAPQRDQGQHRNSRRPRRCPGAAGDCRRRATVSSAGCRARANIPWPCAGNSSRRRHPAPQRLASMSLSRELARLIGDKPVSDADLKHAALFVRDTLACAVAGRDAASARMLRTIAPPASSDVARRAFLGRWPRPHPRDG